MKNALQEMVTVLVRVFLGLFVIAAAVVGIGYLFYRFREIAFLVVVFGPVIALCAYSLGDAILSAITRKLHTA